jgi:hypothetical protein
MKGSEAIGLGKLSYTYTIVLYSKNTFDKLKFKTILNILSYVYCQLQHQGQLKSARTEAEILVVFRQKSISC